MSERNVIQRAFDEFGRGAGAEKKSGSWYRRSEEVIAVSNLQKSQYGQRYYFNQGFWLRELDDERYPKPNKLHVQMRLEGLLPAAEDRINELLDLEREMTDEQRMRELRVLLDEKLLPLIERASTVGGLRAMLADGTLRRAGIRGPAQQVLASVAS
jgi:Domain of unknown function (DUF4304)